MLLFSCNRDDEDANLPTIETKKITLYGSASINTGGYIKDDGGNEIISYGVCWGIEESPTFEDNFKEDNYNENGHFHITIDGLSLATKYYLRAFATNANI